jgi:tRNA-dihydrouridine synthase B
MKNFWQKLNKPILALAPMAGITDSAFRQICKKYGADVVYSEMISVAGLHYNSAKTVKMIDHSKKEQPVVFQLFGKEPKLFIEAAKLIEKKGGAGVDLNFGCPAPKIYKYGGGVKLMRDLDLCYEIVKNTCEAVKIPVSVKLRSSIKTLDKKKIITALDFIKKIKNLPVAAVMIHGRSYEQGFKGEPDFEMIKKLKQKFNGIVLGNGGITTPEKAEAMIKKTKVDGIGLAQGVFGKPWLFQQVKNYLQNGEYNEYEFDQVKKIILEQAQLNYKLKGKRGIFEMRKHLGWYIKGFSGASDLRKQMMKIETLAEIKKILNSSL